MYKDAIIFNRVTTFAYFMLWKGYSKVFSERFFKEEAVSTMEREKAMFNPLGGKNKPSLNRNVAIIFSTLHLFIRTGEALLCRNGF